MGINTLDEIIIQRQSAFPYAKGDLSRMLMHIAIAAKIVSREINKAGIIDILGKTKDINIQGETQQKLDVYANNQFISAIKNSGICAGIASEENDDIIILEDELSQNAHYVVCMDPLDGSSNIDVNVSVGTIFSIYRRITKIGTKVQQKDFLQPGNKLVAAGYILYGSSTMLLYTTGLGTTSFTLDPSIGEFILSEEQLRTPDDGKIYSINQGNFHSFPQGVKEYLIWSQETDKSTNRPHSLRYIGSLVSDFHRNLLKGGLFIYPRTESHPNGKLRLLYECNPIAFLAEQAGGKATDGQGNRILDIQPEDIHQRVPFYVGSKKMVDKIEEFNKKFKN
ncbi:MAG TPA: class 1 fructose-bisphosphatase [Bacteroidales bacterium]|nr:class 1 fructose-bisphosphatase [Bacteroidales bacterium]